MTNQHLGSRPFTRRNLLAGLGAGAALAGAGGLGGSPAFAGPRTSAATTAGARRWTTS